MKILKIFAKVKQHVNEVINKLSISTSPTSTDLVYKTNSLKSHEMVPLRHMVGA